MTEIVKETVTMPLLALRGLVCFPQVLLHFDVGRTKSVKALNAAMESGQKIYLVAQKNLFDEEPDEAGLYGMGCVAHIRQILRMPDETVRVLVEGKYRAKHISLDESGEFPVATLEKCEDAPIKNRKVYVETLARKIRAEFDAYATSGIKLAKDIPLTVAESDDIKFLSDFIAFNIPVPVDDKQYILEQLNPVTRGKLVVELVPDCERCNIENSRILTYLYESIENQIDTSLWDYYDSIEENEENVDDQTVDEFVEIVQSSDVLERLKTFLREKGEKGKKLVVAAVVWLMLNFLSGLLNHYSEPIYRMLTPSFLRQEENAETVELTEIPANTEIHVWNHTENNYIEITYQIDGQDYTGYITKEELDKNTELISSEITFEKICFINDITAVLSNRWKVTPDSVYEFLNGENNLINTYILKNYEALSLLEESALINNIEDYCEYNDIVIPVEKNDISEATE